MREKILIKLGVFVTSTIICLTSIVPAYAEGFGWSKMEVTLNRKSPPRVYIMGTAISVRVKSLVPSASPYSQQMASMLESELIGHDTRLKPEPGNPETLISCEITQLESGEKWEQRHSREQRKTGERQVWNDKKQKYETKPVYEEVAVTRNYKIVSGSVNVSYQVKDTKTGAILDSDTLPSSYLSPFLDGNGAPGLSEVENALVRRVVYMIVPRLTPTTESVKVLLAKGKLENIAKLGKAGLWQKMIEGYEMMPPLKNTKDDSYRLYNTGVGYEALAYQAEDMAVTKKFLDKASVLYNQAIEMKPDEKYFREPQKRIEQAIVQYRKLDDQISTYARAKALKEQEDEARALREQQAKQVPQSPQGRPGAGNQGGKGLGQGEGKPKADQQDTDKMLTNQVIIHLASKGLDETNLIAAIKQARTVQFDLGPEALAHLLENKVSNRVISAMRTRQSAPRGTPRQSRAKKGL